MQPTNQKENNNKQKKNASRGYDTHSPYTHKNKSSNMKKETSKRYSFFVCDVGVESVKKKKTRKSRRKRQIVVDVGGDCCCVLYMMSHPPRTKQVGM